MDPKFIEEMKKLPMVVTTRDTSQNKTGSWSLRKPQFVEKAPPCQVGCPAHVAIREVMTLVKEKKMEEAAQLFLEAHPFPAITGRVCHHPCQTQCLRTSLDGPLEIRQLERYISFFVQTPAPESLKDSRVAVVGSGPSGLACAYYLGLWGYEVTIFERQAKAGGLLRYGIPAYRLADELLDEELARLEKMGIQIKTNSHKNIQTLKESNFEAVFLGLGAHLNKKMNIPGEELDRVISGLEFLSSFEKHREAFSQAKVAVIGGGNTAMDSARVALRLGADVHILYRRTCREMPAIQEEIDGAREEGCHFRELEAPLSITEKEGDLDLLCTKMALGEPDESGRRRPIPQAGSEFGQSYDYILSAIGEDPDLDGFQTVINTQGRAILVDNLGKTNEPTIFAGGDSAGTERTVVSALASGKLAARAMDFYLQKKGDPLEEKIDSSLTFENINSHYFPHQEGAKAPTLPLIERKKGFSEIHATLAKDLAVTEAERCFTCGICTHCDNCFLFCPDFSIEKGQKDYSVKEEYCKGCGICIQECPRGVLKWKE